MTYSEAYEKALQLLNVRFLSEGELRTKLRRRDVSDDVIDEVMAMLKDEHFIDDDRLARQVYANYVRKGQYGHLYIANCLRRGSWPCRRISHGLMNMLWPRHLSSGNFPVTLRSGERRRDTYSTAAFLLPSSPRSSPLLQPVMTSLDGQSK